MLVSIVIPAYNEESTICAHLDAIVDHCAPKTWDFEVVVADDGSVDSTVEKVTAYATDQDRIRLVRLPKNRGKGAAVREGLLAATGDIRGFTDADAATDISQIDVMLSAFDAGADVVIGSRSKKDTETKVVANLHRKIIGRVFNGVLRSLVGLKDQHGQAIGDTQCGFKWFTAEACEAILPRASLDGFAFDVELLYLANRMGFRISELPVNWVEQGDSRVNLFIDPVKMLFQVMRVPLRHRRVRR